MYTLGNFYQSKDWRKLLDVLKSERLDDDGHVVCEYCGKPIVKKYDIIGHHKVYLTDDNVNDFNISLNPDNIMLVHHRCHNYIHNKLGYPCRQVYLVYGAPLAGKAEYVKNNMAAGDLVIDIDNIWQCITGMYKYTRDNKLKSIVFKIRDTLIDCAKYRTGRWSNCYIVGGYPLSSERERLCRELGAREVYIESTRDECLKRLEALDDGRDKDEWRKYIEEWFTRSGA
jgi:hypothetical protein